MASEQAFSPAALAWFEEGETLESRVDLAPYESPPRSRWAVLLATVAVSLAALGSTVWIVLLR
jgi:hypothetical protein